MRTLFLLLLAQALPGSAPAQAQEPAPFRLLQDIALCVPMTQETRDAALCAVRAEEFHWFIANGDATWGGTALPGDPVSSHTLAEFALSPTQNLLALSEADEGHPAASVIDFELWRTQGIIKTLWRTAVYPGYIAISHWQGESLVIASNHDLTRADQLHLAPDNETLLLDRSFLLDPASGSMVPLVGGKSDAQ